MDRRRRACEPVGRTMTASPSNSELANWDDASLVVALVDRIRPRYDEHGLQALNDADRVLLAIFDLDNEVCNGGFGQWLSHVAGDLALTTPACLRQIGDAEVTRLVRRVLDEFGNEGPSADYWERHDQISSLPESADDTIRQCDEAFRDVEEAMHKRLCSYARSHLADIRSP